MPSPRTPSHPATEEAPLLRILVAEAIRRRWTLARLAGALHITYERLAQYRRGDADISNSTRPTLQAAAELLGIPMAAVFVLARRLKVEDFVWPAREPLKERLRNELAQLRGDPLFAGYAHDELSRSGAGVQLLVAVLYREATGSSGRASRLPQLLSALHAATTSSAAAEGTLRELRDASDQEPSVL
jgi:transcriptional regulator with XRE-family HTH domain